MFTITVVTYAGASREISIFAEDLADFYFAQILRCIDVQSVTMIDGFTGEVVEQVVDGKILVFAREVVVD
jgi:hypothetical protein